MKMTVAELITLLAEMPPDLEVCGHGPCYPIKRVCQVNDFRYIEESDDWVDVPMVSVA